MSTYNTGSYPTNMVLLPRTRTTWDQLRADEGDPDAMDTSPEDIGGFQVLCSSSNGSLSLLTTISPIAYRILAALQSYLTTTLPHPLGLNPKGYRAVDADLAVGGRAVLDGDVLKRWMELGAWKRAESVARVGLGSEWEVRALLESVGERGMGFL
jgi:cleavage and polyadenylation specificity factor subunit 1